MRTRWTTFFAHPATRGAVLGIVALWGLYQSCWRLFDANVQTDEPTYQGAGWDYVHGDFSQNLEHPPLAKYLMGLSQLAFGEGIDAARIVVAVLSVLAGVVMFLWLRRDLGWYSGVLAAGLWWLLPRGIGDPTRVDRMALLDGPSAAFAIAAVWAGWRWAKGGRWPWVVVAGVLLAASVTSKESSIVLVPVFVVLPILFRRWWALLWGGAVFAASALATVALVYAQIGAVHGIGYLLHFQSNHDQDGHPVTVAGHVYQYPPWWANLWFENVGTGGLVTAILVVGLVCAIVIRPGRLVLVVGLSLAAYLVFFLLIAAVSLAEYYYDWMPFLTLLAAIGISRLGGLVRLRWLGRVGCAVLVAAILFSGVRLSVVTSTIHHEGLARVQGILDRGDTRIFSAGFAPASVSANFGDHVSIYGNTGPFGAIVVGDDARYPVDPALTAFLTSHASEFRYYDLDGIGLYVPKEGEFEASPTYEVVQ
jgi:4-amino-4-deoxy-L-arabinose transferase-like glycosyltransferase